MSSFLFGPDGNGNSSLRTANRPVNDYLLFVDTETSGIPRDWTQPYANRANWPHIVQLAWVVCTPDGQEVKAENHYIRPNDYDMSPESGKIHGLTPAFLQANGRSRHAVMQRLHRDLLHYQPRVVAHFMQLDFHMLGVGFYRAGLKNPLPALPQFCTMRATGPLLRHGTQGFLRLSELHQRLFQEPLESRRNVRPKEVWQMIHNLHTGYSLSRICQMMLLLISCKLSLDDIRAFKKCGWSLDETGLRLSSTRTRRVRGSRRRRRRV